MPRIANRIVIAVLVSLVVLGGGAVAASAVGAFSPALTPLDPSSYALPLPTPVPPTPGLPAADASLAPDAARIQQGLAGLDRTGLGTVCFQVSDLTGRQVAAEDPDSARLPASSWKILTSMAVLSAYGSAHRFTTTVVSSPTGIVLVGAGDPFLTSGPAVTAGQARAQDLADLTAQALTQAGNASVTLGYDDSLFAGPQWNPAWSPSDAADVAPVSALSIDADGAADANTSSDAAQIFKAMLTAQGITVSSVRSERAAPDATVLASVDSLPLGQIVRRVLATSNNFGAEVLSRHVGVAAGGDGSISSAQSATTAYLQSQSLWADGMSVSDGSGLSSGDRVPASILASAVRMAYADPAYDDVLDGLPVAGVDGTLAYRFDDPDEAAGRGVVRAKTGTNDYVRTLTGFAQTSSGAVVVFSFMLNDLKDDSAGVNWLDEAAAVLAAS